MTKEVNKSWCNDLNICISDDNIIYQDEIVKVARDKYPKAKHHYLILPKIKINTILDLTYKNVELLCRLHRTANEIISRTNLPTEYFKVGYHAVPSMLHLHLHVISKDFISPCLKTKYHWGSFTSDFFIPSETAIKVLCEKGSLTELVESVMDCVKISAIKCHVCKEVFATMPSLKEHLLRHEFLFGNNKAIIL